MKTFKSLLFIIIFILIAGSVKAQFDKPVFQFSAGITNPDKGLRGDSYVRYSNKYRYVNTPFNIDTTLTFPYEITYVDTNLISQNYGGQTGLYFAGTAKINVDKYEVVKLLGSLSFSTFNSFQTSKSGYIPVFNQSYIQQTPISYDYNFNNFGIGLGLEIAPLAFTKLISPFINGQFNFNFMSATLSRTTGPSDSSKISFSDFRMGVNIGAGIEFKVTPQWGFLMGVKYDFGNLLLKNTDRSSRVEWGRTNASINDDEGYYSANIYDPPGTPIRDNIKSAQKQINWATFYIGVNFYPNMSPSKPTKK